MDALITAGGIPQPGEPLYPYTRGGSKSMLALAGKPVVQWVLDAVSACARIQTVLIVGIEPDPALRCTKKIQFHPNQGELITNIRSGMKKLDEISPANPYALLISGDTPGIDGAMLDWLIDQVESEPHEFYYPVVERRIMEARYPGSRRTYARLRDFEVCGGDVMALRKDLAMKTMPRIEQLVSARKQPLKQAAIIGLDTLLLLILGRLTLSAAARKVSSRLEFDGVAIPTPYAELGMDIDKPYQLDLLEKDLARRAVQPGAQ